MRRAAIISLNGSVSTDPFSHRSAWAMMRRQQFLDDGTFDKVDIGHGYVDQATDIIYYFGMEWTGVLNLFGGATKINGDRLRQPIFHAAQRKRLWSLDCAMPDLGLLASKRDAAAKPGWVDKDHPWSDLSKVCKTATRLNQTHAGKSRFVVGDSHALSLWSSGSYIDRRDYQTLYGILNNEEGLSMLVYPRHPYKKIVLYFGNIDVRHHLARQSDPKQATRDLVKKYVEQAARLQRIHKTPVQLAEVLTICRDDRRIPQTGWYKGTPFYGNWHTRDEIRYIFNRQLRDLSRKHGLEDTFKWPHWLSDENLVLRDEFMEKPGSVHLAWAATLKMNEEGILE